MNDEFVCLFFFLTVLNLQLIRSSQICSLKQISFPPRKNGRFSLINTFLLLSGYDTHRRYES